MPLNERKIIEIISEECAGIDERYNGYREDISDVITDILIYEQGHRVSKTNIQKDINERFDKAARSLVKKRVSHTGSEELDL